MPDPGKQGQDGDFSADGAKWVQVSAVGVQVSQFREQSSGEPAGRRADRANLEEPPLGLNTRGGEHRVRGEFEPT